MNSKLLLGLPIIFLTLFSHSALQNPILAEAIKNEIKIQTNTGGNTVNNQTEGENIQTGDTTTSVNISKQTNNLGSETNPNSQNQSTSSTKINIQSSGEGDKQININTTTSQLELIHKNDKAYFKTTNSQGISTEKEFDTREEVLFNQEGLNLRIAPSGKHFVIFHDNLRTYTTEPLSVNQDTSQISLQGNLLQILPSTARSQVLESQILSDAEENLELTLKDNQPTYSFSGSQQIKILGLFPVNIDKTIHFNAQSGEYTENIPSLKHRIFKALAI